jgi:hypothetical protein
VQLLAEVEVRRHRVLEEVYAEITHEHEQERVGMWALSGSMRAKAAAGMNPAPPATK